MQGTQIGSFFGDIKKNGARATRIPRIASVKVEVTAGKLAPGIPRGRGAECNARRDSVSALPTHFFEEPLSITAAFSHPSQQASCIIPHCQFI